MLSLYQNYYFKIFQNKTTINKISFIFNVITSCIQLIIGLFSNSFWYIINAIYYLIICWIRITTVNKTKKTNEIKDKKLKYSKELMIFKQGGVYVCLLAVCYFIICFWSYNTNNFIVPREFYLVYKLATVSFYKVGIAIYGILINYKLYNPITGFLKRINLLDALVSIVVTQCALLTMNNVDSAIKYSASLGIGFSILFLIMGIFMIKRK